MIKKFLLPVVASVLSLAFFLSACSDSVEIAACADSSASFVQSDSVETSTEVSNKKATVVFMLGNSISRTIAASDLTEDDVSELVLTAEVLNGDAYEPFTFDDGSESITWTDLTSMERAKLSLDIGFYNFKLGIYSTSSLTSESRLIQSASLEAYEVTVETTQIPFEATYASTNGDVSVDLVWTLGTDEENLIESVEAGLFTFESKGKEAVEGYDVESLELTSDDKTSYSASYAKNVENGTYYIKFYAYDANSNLMNTYTEIIKVQGFKTNGQITVDTAKLNPYYSITYDLNDESASWSDESQTGVVYRTEYKAATLLTAGVINAPTNCTFDGWYTDSDCSGEAVTEIKAGDTNNYTLYAKWLSTGSFTVTLDTLEAEAEGVVSLNWNENAGTLTATIADGYTLYAWTVDDKDYDSTETSLTLSEMDLDGGYHYITVTVVDSDKDAYTATATVLVTN